MSRTLLPSIDSFGPFNFPTNHESTALFNSLNNDNKDGNGNNNFDNENNNGYNDGNGNTTNDDWFYDNHHSFLVLIRLSTHRFQVITKTNEKQF